MTQEYEKLEKEFGDWCGNPNTVCCASGSAALHLALETLQITKKIKKVAVPDYGMIAIPRSVIMAGLNLVLARDLTPNGLLHGASLDDTDTDAVIAVHTYGWKSFTDYGHEVIEDLAEAHGMKPNPNSYAACWSFYKNKIISGEEGGMISFRNPNDVHLAKELRCMGMNSRHDFWHRPRGWNYRLSNLHAKPIRKSLRKFSKNYKKRLAIWERFNAEFANAMPDSVPWVYPIDVPEQIRPSYLVKDLHEYGIQARLGFRMHSHQIEFTKTPTAGTTEKTKHLGQRIYLPINPKWTKKEVDDIVYTYHLVLNQQSLR